MATVKLQSLDEVTRLLATTVRILAGNPGKFTLQGTNTYLLSRPVELDEKPEQAVPCILVDTGEGKTSYTKLLGDVLQGRDARVGPARRTVSDIILTHWHHDHIGGLASVLQLLRSLNNPPPRIHKLADARYDARVHEQLHSLDRQLWAAPAGQSKGGEPVLHALHDGDTIPLAEGSDTVEVVHTPGHTTDHICLLLRPHGVLLTGDHVLGQGTSVFEDLGAYLHSLRRCQEVLQPLKEASPAAGHLYPAHGPVIEDGMTALQTYLDHRLERERQIVQLLAQPSPQGSSAAGSTATSPAWTIPDVVAKLYSHYPESLYPAAARGVFLHLHKLARPDPTHSNASSGPQQKDGVQVRCSGKGVEANGWAPDVPENEAGWLGVMELQWSLLEPSAVGEGGERGSL